MWSSSPETLDRDRWRPQAQAVSGPPTLEGRRVLIIEDDADCVLLVADALPAVELVHVERRAEAIAALETGRFDALLIDLNLPDSRGLTIVEALRPLTDAALVVLSGEDDAVGVQAVAMGAEDYLSKAHLPLVGRTLLYALERRSLARRRANLEAELRSAVELRTRELSQANEDLRAFVRSASHDLRGPLRIVGALADILRDQYGLGAEVDTEARELFDRLARVGMRAKGLLDGLLHLSEALHGELRVSPTDLAALARDVLENLNIGRAEVVLPERLVAACDPSLARLLLRELLDNALTFSSSVSAPRVELGQDAEGYFVRDNGLGFDSDHAERIFEPFRRLRPGLSGHGLGLVTVRRAAERHGGRAWASSEPGHGAVVWFRFEP